MTEFSMEAVLANAEEALAQARTAGERQGLNDEAYAIAVLANALAMAVADAIGPAADVTRLEQAANLAADQVFDLVPPHWAQRARAAAGTA